MTQNNETAGETPPFFVLGASMGGLFVAVRSARGLNPGLSKQLKPPLTIL